MPLGSLEAIPKGARLWETVYESATDRGHSEERAAQQAWGAVKRAGYYQDGAGEWHAPGNHPEPYDVNVGERGPVLHTHAPGEGQGVRMLVPVLVGLGVGALAAWITYTAVNEDA